MPARSVMISPIVAKMSGVPRPIVATMVSMSKDSFMRVTPPRAPAQGRDPVQARYLVVGSGSG